MRGPPPVMTRMLAVSALALVAGLPQGARGQADPELVEGLDGPSRMDALMGNGRLTVGASADGVVTVLRWPNPAHFDHLHHVTARGLPSGTQARQLPRMGAGPTDGMVLGVVVDDGSGPRVVAMDDPGLTRREQGYASDLSPVARWQASGGQLTLTQEALVLSDRDVLVMRVEVEVREPVQSLAAFLLAHPAPHARRWRYLPVTDFFLDDPDRADPNGFMVAVDEVAEAVVAVSPGPSLRGPARDRLWPRVELMSGPGADLLAAVDPFSAVALAFGCDRHVQLQVGASDRGAGVLRPRDALADLADGQLDGNTAVLGDATLALLAPLTPQGRSEVTFYLGVATTPREALAALAEARRQPARQVWEDADSAAQGLARDLALPATDDPAARAAALRSLLTLKALGAEGGSISVSATTQPALGLDRPTDAAVVDAALAASGQIARALSHRRFWAAQVRALDDEGGPAGTVPGGVYPDGEPASVVGMPSDGLALSLWAHAAVVQRSLSTVELPDPTRPLRELAPSARALADALWRCFDPVTRLPCRADEWDRPALAQTVWQAAAMVAALREGASLMRLLADDSREANLRRRLPEALSGLQDLLRATAEPPLHALALALGEAEAFADDPAARGALLDQALRRARDVLDARAPPTLHLPLALWQLLVATRQDPGRQPLARALLDRLVKESLSPFGQVGQAMVARADGARLAVEQRHGTPAAVDQAALVLALLERHGRRPPASLPVPDLPQCGCRSSPGTAPPLASWLLAVAAMAVRRRGTRRAP